jgi:hypothetical protein
MPVVDYGLQLDAKRGTILDPGRLRNGYARAKDKENKRPDNFVSHN